MLLESMFAKLLRCWLI